MGGGGHAARTAAPLPPFRQKQKQHQPQEHAARREKRRVTRRAKSKAAPAPEAGAMRREKRRPNPSQKLPKGCACAGIFPAAKKLRPEKMPLRRVVQARVRIRPPSAIAAPLFYAPRAPPPRLSRSAGAACSSLRQQICRARSRGNAGSGRRAPRKTRPPVCASSEKTKPTSSALPRSVTKPAKRPIPRRIGRLFPRHAARETARRGAGLGRACAGPRKGRGPAHAKSGCENHPVPADTAAENFFPPFWK
jgi:hypothetical protein